MTATRTRRDIRDLVLFHAAFSVFCGIALSLLDVGIGALVSVIFYAAGIFAFTGLKNWAELKQLAAFGLCLSVFQVLPDAFLATVLGTLEFPQESVPKFSNVSIFMFGMWQIPCVITVQLARGVEARRGVVLAALSAAVIALVVFGGSEFFLSNLGIWHATDKIDVWWGPIAVYVLLPEAALGSAMYLGARQAATRPWWMTPLLAATVSAFYCGALAFSYLAIEA